MELFSLGMVLPIIFAIAIFAIIIMVVLPLFENENLKSRMRKVAAERESLKNKFMEDLDKKKTQQQKTIEPHKYALMLHENFDFLHEQQNNSELSVKMARAGYRGKGAIINYLALRAALPFILGVFGFFYCLVILKVPFLDTLILTAGAAFLGFMLPSILLKNKTDKRILTIKRAWPDTLDLILLCVESGMSIEHAIKRVMPEIGEQSPVLAEELSVLDSELSFLSDRTIAYDNFAARVNLDIVKSVMTALKQAEKFGTSVGQSLRVLAEEGRALRLSEAEQKAASLPPKLTVPLIVFFLPVLFIVILSPALIQVFNQ